MGNKNIVWFTILSLHWKWYSKIKLTYNSILIAYEVKQPILDAKLAALRSHSPEVASWINKIPLQKWTQAYDGGNSFRHMTTNLVECMNSVLKIARSLPICALIKATFERTATWFVERAVKAYLMLQASHQYPEEINAIIRKNQQQARMYQVHQYSRENNEFQVQETFSPHDHNLPISFTVKLNDWWCDCGHFQVVRLPCHHVIVVCSFSYINLTTYIHPVYSLYNISKAYEIQFHPVQNKDYWFTYPRPNFILDPNMRRRVPGRPPITRIHNEMDKPNLNKQSKCSYCRNEGNHRG